MKTRDLSLLWAFKIKKIMALKINVKIKLRKAQSEIMFSVDFERLSEQKT